MPDDIFELAAEPDAFDTPLRNIRVRLDGTAACFDLIPSVVLDRRSERTDFPTETASDEAIADMLAGGRPIVEASRLMRVWFESVSAVVIQEEFVELHPTLQSSYDQAPRLKGGKAVYPFLIVTNSQWKRRLPDYQGGDSATLKHFKILSMESHIDILGFLEKIEWLPN
jgi:hypothetical protein